MSIQPVLQAGLPGGAETTVSRAGDVITVDGVAHDFTALIEGGDAPNAGSAFDGPVTRDGGGNLCAQIVYRYDPSTALPVQPRPAAWDAAGAMPDPVARRE